MRLGQYRISVIRQAEGAVIRHRGRAALVAVSTVAIVGMAAPPAFASSSNGTATFGLSTQPQIFSVTVSQTISTFNSCSGGNSTASSLGFPNGTCFAGVLDGYNGSSFTPAVSITNTGEPGNIEINGANAIPSDNGTPWTLCTYNVTGSTLCGGSNSGSGAGLDQYSLYGGSGNERAGVPNVLNTAACDQLFDVQANNNSGCAATSGQVGSEGFQLAGPKASTDTSTSWSIAVTWTAVPSS